MLIRGQWGIEMSHFSITWYLLQERIPNYCKLFVSPDSDRRVSYVVVLYQVVLTNPFNFKF